MDRHHPTRLAVALHGLAVGERVVGHEVGGALAGVDAALEAELPAARRLWRAGRDVLADVEGAEQVGVGEDALGVVVGSRVIVTERLASSMTAFWAPWQSMLSTKRAPGSTSRIVTTPPGWP